MLVLGDDNERVRSRQDVWQTARSRRIFVNPFLTRAQSFAWRRHEVGTLEYEVQVDGIRLYPAERLCCGSRGLPWAVIAEDGVEDDQELAHAGGDGDFGRPAAPDQALVEGLQRRIAANGGQGRHV